MSDTPAFSPQRSAGFALSRFDVQAVLLDLDGTLVNTLDEFERALNYMLHALQLGRVGREAIAQTIGKGSEHLVRTILALALQQAGRPHDAAAVQALFDEAMQRYFEGYEGGGTELAKVFAGAAEGLALLKAKGLPLAVVTNKPMRLAQPLLQAFGMDALIEFIHAGDSFDKRKPDPYPLLRACERLGVAPRQTLMVGDSRNDALAARAAGCAVVLMRYGFNHGEPIESVDADGYFDSLLDVAEQLPTRAHGPAGRTAAAERAS